MSSAEANQMALFVPSVRNLIKIPLASRSINLSFSIEKRQIAPHVLLFLHPNFSNSLFESLDANPLLVTVAQVIILTKMANVYLTRINISEVIVDIVKNSSVPRQGPEVSFL
jgi:hypothetical protein